MIKLVKNAFLFLQNAPRYVIIKTEIASPHCILLAEIESAKRTARTGPEVRSGNLACSLFLLPMVWGAAARITQDPAHRVHDRAL